MCKKRTISTIKNFDYSSREEFEKDVEKMKQKGYQLICDGMFGGVLDPQEMDDENWKFTAYFVKIND